MKALPNRNKGSENIGAMKHLLENKTDKLLRYERP